MAEALWAKDLPLDLQLHRFTVGADPVTDSAADALRRRGQRRPRPHAGRDRTAARRRRPGPWWGPWQGPAPGGPGRRAGDPARGGGLPHRPGARPHRTAGRHRQAHPPGPLPQRPGGHRPAPAHARPGPGPGPGRPCLRRGVPGPGPAGGGHARCPATPTCAGPCPPPGACGPPPSPRGCWRTWRPCPALWDRLDRCPLGAAAGFGPPIPLDRARSASAPGLLPGPAQPHGRHEQPGPPRAGGGRLGGLGRRHPGKGPVGPGPVQHRGIRLHRACRTPSPPAPASCPRSATRTWWSWPGPGAGSCAAWPACWPTWPGACPPATTGTTSCSRRRSWRLLAKGEELFRVFAHLLPGLEIAGEACAAACTQELHAAQEACRLAAEGMPFRDAYRVVAEQIKDGTFAPAPERRPWAALGLEDTAAARRPAWPGWRAAGSTSTAPPNTFSNGEPDEPPRPARLLRRPRHLLLRPLAQVPGPRGAHRHGGHRRLPARGAGAHPRPGRAAGRRLPHHPGRPGRAVRRLPAPPDRRQRAAGRALPPVRERRAGLPGQAGGGPRQDHGRHRPGPRLHRRRQRPGALRRGLPGPGAGPGAAGPHPGTGPEPGRGAGLPGRAGLRVPREGGGVQRQRRHVGHQRRRQGDPGSLAAPAGRGLPGRRDGPRRAAPHPGGGLPPGRARSAWTARTWTRSTWSRP